jgi:cell wall assembly regulator SMI1
VAESIPLTEGLLEQLGAQWRKYDVPIARRLAPGMSDKEMDALTEPLGLRVPPEARTWWRWHNGAHEASIVTSGGKTFSSLERCVSLAAEMRGIAHEVARPYHLSAREADDMARGVWNWDWLPLSSDGVGGMLIIDAAVDNAPTEVCPVWYRAIDFSSDQAVLVAPSMGALVHHWRVALATAAEPYDHVRDLWVLDDERLPAGYDERLL